LAGQAWHDAAQAVTDAQTNVSARQQAYNDAAQTAKEADTNYWNCMNKVLG